MAKKTKTKRGSGTQTDLPDFDSPQYWKVPAMAVIGKDADEWELMEIGTILQGCFVCLRDHYKDINRIANKQGGINASLSIKTDREVKPPTIAVNGTYAEKHKMKFKSDCPDPNAMDLPGLSREDIKAQQEPKEGDTAGKEENEGTGEAPY